MNNRYKNSFINFTILIVTLVICIGAIELASSILYEKIAPERGKKAIDVLVNGRQAHGTGRYKDGTVISEIEILPYYLYRNKAFSKIDGVQQVNREGYRNGTKEFGKKEKGKIRIIAIGGSTTFGSYIKDYKKTWPLQLEKILNKKFGSNKVEVINAGLPNGMSSEQLIAFFLKEKYLEPDMVIFHNGGNDASTLWYKDYYTDYRFHRSVSGAEQLRPGERKLIQKSNFIKILYAFWMKNATLSLIKTGPKTFIELKEALENIKQHSPVGFERNMNTMIQETLNIGATPVIFPFHMASYKIYDVIPKHLRYTKRMYPATVKSLAKNKLVLKSLSKKYNLGYFEMDQNKVPLDHFFDYCHLTPEGDRIKAEFIAKYVIQILKKVLPR